MSKMAPTILILCAVLAGPALGDWIWDGTGTEISDPFYWEAADGTCGCGWNGSSCSVDGDEHNLTASGETWGEAWALLTPDDGLSRYVWAASHVYGWSDYYWDPCTPHYVEGELSIDISGSLDFSGDALDRTGTCAASAYSSCWAGGEVRNPFGRPATGEGSCYGWAYSTSGTYAYTDPGNVTPTNDWADYWQGFWCGEYEGELDFTGSLYAQFSDDVQSDWFSIEAEVYGGSDAGGQLVINDPNFYWGGFDASAYYDSNGTSYVYVTW